VSVNRALIYMLL